MVLSVVCFLLSIFSALLSKEISEARPRELTFSVLRAILMVGFGIFSIYMLLMAFLLARLYLPMV